MQSIPARYFARRLAALLMASAALCWISGDNVCFAQPSQAVVVNAAFSSAIVIDGDSSDWTNLPSGVISMDTKGRGTNYGTLAVDIQYAWDYTNLYVLVSENTNNAIALVSQEATDATAYQSAPWSVDSIGFWIDLDNDAGTTNGGSLVVENNADFQPWFGFSSGARTDLVYARQNDSGSMNLDGVANAQVATSGTFAKHNRKIEVALKWADIASAVDTSRQPGGDLTQAILPGFTFGSEPLLICKDFNGQAFIGPNQWSPGSGTDLNSRDIRLISAAKVIDAPFTSQITIDGNASDWAGLPGGVVSMNTQGRGTNGTLAVDIRYAWDYTNLYVLVKENTNQFLATQAQEAPDGAGYQSAPWAFDTIAFWLDLDNNCGLTNGNGGIVVENNADFQPWFGFSSGGRTDLMYARQNDSGSLNLDGLANAQVATGGTFARHDRTIEIAMKWADIAASVDPSRQPGGDISKTITPGFTFGSEPLLILVDYNGQAFISTNQFSPGNGVDIYSRDIRLVSGAKIVGAAYSSSIKVDGNTSDWANLPSGVTTMDTQGRGTNGTLAVDIKYAWNYSNLYVLVMENTNRFTAENAQEAPDATAYQNAPWANDTIAFWIDLDNDAGTTNGSGGIVVENNADFQPWFGFSSSGRTDLIYARQNDSGNMNMDGLANAQVATSGTFAQHNRTIEIAMKWADMAVAVDPSRQPGGDVRQAVAPGFTFGSEPLLILVDYNGQAFIGTNQWSPGNGVDSYSRDIQLLDDAIVPTLSLSVTNWSGTAPDTIVLSWPAAATGFVLESTPIIGAGAVWTSAGDPFLDTDELNKVILPAPTGTATFYRLRK